MIEALLDVWKGVERGSEKLMVVVRGQEAMARQIFNSRPKVPCTLHLRKQTFRVLNVVHTGSRT